MSEQAPALSPSTTTPLPRVALLTLVFFCSGAAGLVYEVTWSKRLELTFGTTSYSIGTILASYMAGLGLGAWLLGRLADRPGSASRRYAALELGIGVYAILAPWILDLVEWVYVAVGGVGGTPLKAVLSLIAILPATLCMGGTLPVLARALVQRRSHTQRAVGFLYGINTLGAVAGATLAGFILVRTFGMDALSRYTGVFNLLLGGLALLLGERLAPDIQASEHAQVVTPPPDSQASRMVRWRVALIATFACGMVALTLEVAWTRALSLAFGSTGHGFTIMLAATLLGIGGGSLLVAREVEDERQPLGHLALALLLLALAGYAFVAGFERLPRLLLVVAQGQYLYYEQFLTLFFLISTAILLPATIALGIAFPLCTQLGTRAAGEAGSLVGRLYLSNTAGAILGSLAGGFLLVPWLGTEGVLRTGAGVAALGAAALGWLAVSHGSWKPLRGRLMVIVGLGLTLLLLVRPSWSPSSLDMAPTRQRQDVPRNPGGFKCVFERAGFMLRMAEEGLNAYVSVRTNSTTTTLLLGGKPDASTLSDMPTQLLCGAVPVLARPQAKRALVVGAGSGVTTRVVAGFPGMQVDLVEIERSMVHAARNYFGSVNHGVFDRDNVNVVYEDARTYLLAQAQGQYDVIVAVPTNPSIAGVANLFTLEHYENARRRLAPGGVYMQWIQLYQSDDAMGRAMLRTFLQAFPHVDLWWANASDLLLVGSDQPLVYDLAQVQRAVEGNQDLAQDLWPYLHCHSVPELFARYLTGEDALKFVAGNAEVLHDRFPRLEAYAARARYLGTSALTLREELFSLQRDRPSPWPALTGPPPDVDLALPAARALAFFWPTQTRRLLAGREDPQAVALYARCGPAGERLPSLQAALAAHPHDFDLLLGTALAYRALGELEPARPLLAELATQERAKSSPRYHLLRALAVQPKDADRAEAVLDEAVAGLDCLLPRDADMKLRRELLFRIADCAVHSPRAIQLLTDRWQAAPWDEEAGFALGLAYLAAHHPEQTLEVLDVMDGQTGSGDIAFAHRLRLRALDAAGDNAGLFRELDAFLRDYPQERGNPLLFPWIQRARQREGKPPAPN